MSQCTAITRGGERCSRVAIDASGLCYSHNPNRADARKRSARKGGKRGGRGRPVVELASIKEKLEGLADDVLAGSVGRSDAAVVSQIYNVVLRAISTSLKAREQEELEARVEELEALLDTQKRRDNVS